MSKESNSRPATAHIPPFGLRMQPELRASLQEAAVENGRSLNAEIVARLEASFHRDVLSLKTGELIDALLDRFPPGKVSVTIGKVEDDHDQE